jgi:iron-sulfur cluster assembly protein
VFETDGVKVVVDPESFQHLNGTEIDYVDGLTGAGFTMKNPNAMGGCGCGSSCGSSCK